MAKKTGLGRGLGSLISGGINTPPPAKKKTSTKKTSARKKPAGRNKPSSKAKKVSTKMVESPAAKDVTKNALGLFEIPVNRIAPNPRQPRKEFNDSGLQELSESIRSEGLLQPVVVRKIEDSYELIAGERRWRACKMLKLKLIPAHIVEATESSSAVLSLIENLQRQDLNPIEESMGYASLMRDFDLTQEQVAERVGKNRATVANSIRLLQLPREIQGYITKGLISVGHAKVLLGIDESQTRLLLARQSIERGWSVRELERQMGRMKPSGDRITKSRISIPAEEERAIDDLQKQLSTNFSTRVLLKHTPKKGKIIIEYYGNDDLQRIIEQIGLH